MSGRKWKDLFDKGAGTQGVVVDGSLLLNKPQCLIRPNLSDQAALGGVPFGNRQDAFDKGYESKARSPAAGASISAPSSAVDSPGPYSIGTRPRTFASGEGLNGENREAAIFLTDRVHNVQFRIVLVCVWV